MNIENTETPAAFKQIVLETSQSLNVSHETSLLLLVNNQWNLAALIENHLIVQQYLSVIDRCHQSNGVVFVGELCPLCSSDNGCFVLACGHWVCENCLRVAIHNQLANRNLMVVCPTENCGAFVLCSNLPNQIQSKYVNALVQDYNTAPIRRGLRFVWKHRVKFVMAYQLLIKGSCMAEQGSCMATSKSVESADY